MIKNISSNSVDRWEKKFINYYYKTLQNELSNQPSLLYLLYNNNNDFNNNCIIITFSIENLKIINDKWGHEKNSIAIK